jgi:hypothetical protein
MSGAKLAALVAGLACVLASASCRGAGSSPTLVVKLQRITDRAPSRWAGMSNIFFDSIPPAIRDSVRLDKSWTDVQLADVVSGDGLVTVYAARFKLPGAADTQYVVDTNGDLDFTNEQPLTFRIVNDLRVADLDIDVRAKAGTRRRVPYQVLLGDGYTYARIAEYDGGVLRLAGREYAVKIRSAFRNYPFHARNEGTLLFIDLDGDGRIAEYPDGTARGLGFGPEQVDISAPFLLAGRAYEVATIDSAGSQLVLRPSDVRVAAVVGFQAPDFTAQLPSGVKYQLTGDRGKVTLIEFWSVECAFSETARAALNELAKRQEGSGFTWVALARENDARIVQRHLVSHPMNATVALYDSAAWAVYNPSVATPLFYVIGQDGQVELKALGASAVQGVATKVETLSRPVGQSAPTASSPADTAQAIAFLEFLKQGESPAAQTRGFDPSQGGYWDNARFIRFLDAGGVTFSDINGDTTWHLSVGRIRSQVASRSGASYTMLVHLGHIYSQTEPQYSKLTFSEDAQRVSVTVGSWYRLSFVRRGKSLRLAKIEYVMKEVEQ